MSLFWGDRLGRFTILDALGAGGMGEVYRAFDETRREDVALKVLREGRDDPRHAKRILREGKAAAELVHPNVVTVLDVGEAAGPDGELTTYLAMELVTGLPLRAYVGDATVPLATRGAWLLDVARALAAAHARGIAHRDVKPENVMVRADGVVKVLDFGLAKRLEGAASDGLPRLTTLTVTGAKVGTPMYMSPEQLRGEALDARSDQFAWAVMAYELVTGAHPWRASDAIGSTADALSRDVEPIRARAPEVPAAWAGAIERALSKAKERRFPSMDALVAAMTGQRAPLRMPRLSLRAIAIACAAASAIALVAARAPLRAFTAPAPAGAARASIASRGVPATRGCELHADPASPGASDPLWLGAILPLTTDPTARADANALDLARRDFGATFGLVVCDDAPDPDHAALHLVEEAHIPAVIVGSPAALDLAARRFTPAGVLTVASRAASRSIADVTAPSGGPRLVWTTAFDPAATATPIARFIDDVLAPRARALPDGPGRAGVLRVALLRERASSPALARALATAVIGAYREIVVDPSPDAAVTELATFAPHVVVLDGPDRLVTDVVAPAETRWPRASRPLHVTAGPLSAAALRYAIADGLPRRFFGVAPVATAVAPRFAARYEAAFHAPPPPSAAAAYDAFYLLAYAASALGSERPTGPALARAFDRLVPPGPAVDVGPVGIPQALHALESGGWIDLNGALGRLDLDPARGAAPFDYAFLCATDEGSAESGLVYESAPRHIAGSLGCR